MVINYTLTGEAFYSQPAWREYYTSLLKKREIEVAALAKELKELNNQVESTILNSRKYLTLEMYYRNKAVFNKHKVIEKNASRIHAYCIEKLNEYGNR
jgi:hypothetical protein